MECKQMECVYIVLSCKAHAAGLSGEDREAGERARQWSQRATQERLPLQEEPLQEEVLRVFPGQFIHIHYALAS